ncbi:MAG: carbohydrate-binding module family 20 domain-containing protein, partial [Deltaproteobacteria bacterium]
MRKHRAVCRFLFLWSVHVLCIALGQVEAQEIEVYVNVPRFTPVGENIYLTGDTAELCQWTPDCLKMVPFSENVYKTKIKRSLNEKMLQLKVTRGTWDKQASDPKGVAWGNLMYQFPLNSKFIVISVENWTDLGPLSTQGNIDEYPQFYSPELNNRRNIHVWTPPNYNANPLSRFQVLYMHDGQNVFDPSTSTFGVPWGVDGAITSLLEKNAIDQTIVVALD